MKPQKTITTILIASVLLVFTPQVLGAKPDGKGGGGGGGESDPTLADLEAAVQALQTSLENAENRITILEDNQAQIQETLGLTLGGDPEERIVFLTQNLYAASVIGGTAGADAKCATDATNAGLTGIYFA